MRLHVPHPWKERREAEQAAGIAQIHADMAAMEGPVGELSRLYDRLRDAAAAPDSGISYRGEITHERRRGMYVGGTAFAGAAVEGPVAVSLRRSTMWSRSETHPQLTVILNSGKSRIRGEVHPYHRDRAAWVSEGSFSGSDRNLSTKAPELTDMKVMGLLVERVVLLADSMQQEGGELVTLQLPAGTQIAEAPPPGRTIIARLGGGPQQQ